MEGDGPTQDEARAFLAGTDFLWHQRFDLVPGVPTPGVSDIGFLLAHAGLPADLEGRSVIDIGTTNGGTAFELERRGAGHVVAVDVAPVELFGFDEIKRFTGSSVEFLQASLYELPDLLPQKFDIVVFWGVLYHLRHPLLALDCVRALARDRVLVETAVADHELGSARSSPLIRFYRGDELAADPTNWFAPTVTALEDWMASSGFEVVATAAWPQEAPQRCLVQGRVVPGAPEYELISYERPLRACMAAPHLGAQGG